MQQPSWQGRSNRVHDAYIAIANAIAGGAIALSERCSSGSMIRDENGTVGQDEREECLVTDGGIERSRCNST
jgi:hypothetical protein